MAIVWATTALLSVLGGWYAQPYLAQKSEFFTKEEAEKPEPILNTDSFSIRLFQNALAEKQQGNILVAPHIVSDALCLLQDFAGGKTLEELQALQLLKTKTIRATEPQCAILPAMDFNLPRTDVNQAAMPLPFSEDVPMALSLFNGALGNALGKTDIRLADSKTVTERTKLLVGCVTDMNKAWEQPFYSADTRTADFDNASGGMPHFRQLRGRGLYRTAKAEDNSWKAVAIPFRKEADKGAPLVYIGILPAGSARDFAEKLSAEQLTAIRKALAEATPEDTLVEIPRQELQILPYDMRDSLRRLRLKALFDSENADFSRLTPEKIHLGAFLHAASISLVETPGNAKAREDINYAKEIISFARPYIWLITDLETDVAIEYIGLVEEM